MVAAPGDDVIRFRQRALPYVVFAALTAAYVAWRWQTAGHFSLLTILLAWFLWAIIRAQATTYVLTDTHLEFQRPWHTRRIPYAAITRVERQRTLMFGGGSVLVQTGAGGFGGVLRISYIENPDTVIPALETRVAEAA